MNSPHFVDALANLQISDLETSYAPRRAIAAPTPQRAVFLGNTAICIDAKPIPLDELQFSCKSHVESILDTSYFLQTPLRTLIDRVSTALPKEQFHKICLADEEVYKIAGLPFLLDCVNHIITANPGIEQLITPDLLSNLAQNFNQSIEKITLRFYLNPKFQHERPGLFQSLVQSLFANTVSCSHLPEFSLATLALTRHNQPIQLHIVCTTSLSQPYLTTVGSLEVQLETTRSFFRVDCLGNTLQWCFDCLFKQIRVTTIPHISQLKRLFSLIKDGFEPTEKTLLAIEQRLISSPEATINLQSIDRLWFELQKHAPNCSETKWYTLFLLCRTLCRIGHPNEAKLLFVRALETPCETTGFWSHLSSSLRNYGLSFSDSDALLQLICLISSRFVESHALFHLFGAYVIPFDLQSAVAHTLQLPQALFCDPSFLHALPTLPEMSGNLPSVESSLIDQTLSQLESAATPQSYLVALALWKASRHPSLKAQVFRQLPHIFHQLNDSLKRAVLQALLGKQCDTTTFVEANGKFTQQWIIFLLNCPPDLQGEGLAILARLDSTIKKSFINHLWVTQPTQAWSYFHQCMNVATDDDIRSWIEHTLQKPLLVHHLMSSKNAKHLAVCATVAPNLCLEVLETLSDTPAFLKRLHELLAFIPAATIYTKWSHKQLKARFDSLVDFFKIKDEPLQIVRLIQVRVFDELSNKIKAELVLAFCQALQRHLLTELQLIDWYLSLNIPSRIGPHKQLELLIELCRQYPDKRSAQVQSRLVALHKHFSAADLQQTKESIQTLCTQFSECLPLFTGYLPAEKKPPAAQTPDDTIRKLLATKPVDEAALLLLVKAEIPRSQKIWKQLIACCSHEAIIAMWLELKEQLPASLQLYLWDAFFQSPQTPFTRRLLPFVRDSAHFIKLLGDKCATDPVQQQLFSIISQLVSLLKETPNAEEDLVHLCDWIVPINPNTADKVTLALDVLVLACKQRASFERSCRLIGQLEPSLQTYFSFKPQDRVILRLLVAFEHFFKASFQYSAHSQSLVSAIRLIESLKKESSPLYLLKHLSTCKDAVVLEALLPSIQTVLSKAEWVEHEQIACTALATLLQIAPLATVGKIYQHYLLNAANPPRNQQRLIPLRPSSASKLRPSLAKALHAQYAQFLLKSLESTNPTSARIALDIDLSYCPKVTSTYDTSRTILYKLFMSQLGGFSWDKQSVNLLTHLFSREIFPHYVELPDHHEFRLLVDEMPTFASRCYQQQASTTGLCLEVTRWSSVPFTAETCTLTIIHTLINTALQYAHHPSLTDLQQAVYLDFAHHLIRQLLERYPDEPLLSTHITSYVAARTPTHSHFAQHQHIACSLIRQVYFQNLSTQFPVEQWLTDLQISKESLQVDNQEALSQIKRELEECLANSKAVSLTQISSIQQRLARWHDNQSTLFFDDFAQSIEVLCSLIKANHITDATILTNTHCLLIPYGRAIGLQAGSTGKAQVLQVFVSFANCLLALFTSTNDLQTQSRLLKHFLHVVIKGYQGGLFFEFFDHYTDLAKEGLSSILKAPNAEMLLHLQATLISKVFGLCVKKEEQVPKLTELRSYLTQQVTAKFG